MKYFFAFPSCLFLLAALTVGSTRIRAADEVVEENCLASNFTIDQFGPLPCSDGGLNYVESDGVCPDLLPCKWSWIEAWVTGCNANAATLECNENSSPILNGAATCDDDDITMECGAPFSGLIQVVVKGSGGGGLAGIRVSLNCAECLE
jgi:hypothetical protein